MESSECPFWSPVVPATLAANGRAGKRQLQRETRHLRGLHFQYPPAAETKYVRCTKGAVFDVIVDLRPESPTYLEHLVVVLSTENGRGLYVPKGFAHGLSRSRTTPN